MDKVILLVEDNPDDEALTLRSLKKNNIGNDVVVVRDGAEALDYLFGTGSYSGRDMRIMPTVTLLDLNLPKIGGLEVLRRLRSDERTKLIPVIILTSSKEEQDIINSYQLGANSYIRKPVDFVQFAEAIHQLMLNWLVINEPPPTRKAPSVASHGWERCCSGAVLPQSRNKSLSFILDSPIVPCPPTLRPDVFLESARHRAKFEAVR